MWTIFVTIVVAVVLLLGRVLLERLQHVRKENLEWKNRILAWLPSYKGRGRRGELETSSSPLHSMSDVSMSCLATSHKKWMVDLISSNAVVVPCEISMDTAAGMLVFHQCALAGAQPSRTTTTASSSGTQNISLLLLGSLDPASLQSFQCEADVSPNTGRVRPSVLLSDRDELRDRHGVDAASIRLSDAQADEFVRLVGKDTIPNRYDDGAYALLLQLNNENGGAAAPFLFPSSSGSSAVVGRSGDVTPPQWLSAVCIFSSRDERFVFVEEMLVMKASRSLGSSNRALSSRLSWRAFLALKQQHRHDDESRGGVRAAADLSSSTSSSYPPPPPLAELLLNRCLRNCHSAEVWENTWMQTISSAFHEMPVLSVGSLPVMRVSLASVTVPPLADAYPQLSDVVMLVGEGATDPGAAAVAAKSPSRQRRRSSQRTTTAGQDTDPAAAAPANIEPPPLADGTPRDPNIRFRAAMSCPSGFLLSFSVGGKSLPSYLQLTVHVRVARFQAPHVNATWSEPPSSIMWLRFVQEPTFELFVDVQHANSIGSEMVSVLPGISKYFVDKVRQRLLKALLPPRTMRLVMSDIMGSGNHVPVATTGGGDAGGKAIEPHSKSPPRHYPTPQLPSKPSHIIVAQSFFDVVEQEVQALNDVKRDLFNLAQECVLSETAFRRRLDSERVAFDLQREEAMRQLEHSRCQLRQERELLEVKESDLVALQSLWSRQRNGTIDRNYVSPVRTRSAISAVNNGPEVASVFSPVDRTPPPAPSPAAVSHTKPYVPHLALSSISSVNSAVPPMVDVQDDQRRRQPPPRSRPLSQEVVTGGSPLLTHTPPPPKHLPPERADRGGLTTPPPPPPLLQKSLSPQLNSEVPGFMERSLATTSGNEVLPTAQATIQPSNDEQSSSANACQSAVTVQEVPQSLQLQHSVVSASSPAPDSQICESPLGLSAPTGPVTTVAGEEEKSDAYVFGHVLTFDIPDATLAAQIEHLKGPIKVELEEELRRALQVDCSVACRVPRSAIFVKNIQFMSSVDQTTLLTSSANSASLRFLLSTVNSTTTTSSDEQQPPASADHDPTPQAPDEALPRSGDGMSASVDSVPSRRVVSSGAATIVVDAKSQRIPAETVASRLENPLLRETQSVLFVYAARCLAENGSSSDISRGRPDTASTTTSNRAVVQSPSPCPPICRPGTIDALFSANSETHTPKLTAAMQHQPSSSSSSSTTWMVTTPGGQGTTKAPPPLRFITPKTSANSVSTPKTYSRLLQLQKVREEAEAQLNASASSRKRDFEGQQQQHVVVPAYHVDAAAEPIPAIMDPLSSYQITFVVCEETAARSGIEVESISEGTLLTQQYQRASASLHASSTTTTKSPLASSRLRAAFYATGANKTIAPDLAEFAEKLMSDECATREQLDVLEANKRKSIMQMFLYRQRQIWSSEREAVEGEERRGRWVVQHDEAEGRVAVCQRTNHIKRIPQKELEEEDLTSGMKDDERGGEDVDREQQLASSPLLLLSPSATSVCSTPSSSVLRCRPSTPLTQAANQFLYATFRSEDMRHKHSCLIAMLAMLRCDVSRELHVLHVDPQRLTGCVFEEGDVLMDVGGEALHSHRHLRDILTARALNIQKRVLDIEPNVDVWRAGHYSRLREESVTSEFPLEFVVMRHLDVVTVVLTT